MKLKNYMMELSFAWEKFIKPNKSGKKGIEEIELQNFLYRKLKNSFGSKNVIKECNPDGKHPFDLAIGDNQQLLCEIKTWITANDFLKSIENSIYKDIKLLQDAKRNLRKEGVMIVIDQRGKKDVESDKISKGKSFEERIAQKCKEADINLLYENLPTKTGKWIEQTRGKGFSESSLKQMGFQFSPELVVKIVRKLEKEAHKCIARGDIINHYLPHLKSYPQTYLSPRAPDEKKAFNEYLKNNLPKFLKKGLLSKREYKPKIYHYKTTKKGRLLAEIY